MSDLFQPLQIRTVKLKNRIVVSPMCQYSSEDGFANDWHLVHLGSRAVGGAGLVFAEATAVSPEGRITHNDLGLWKDEQIEFLKRITDFITDQDSVPGIQLAHAGRKASHHRPWDGGQMLLPNENPWQTFAPSPVAYKEGEPIPKELTVAEIQSIISDFKLAAIRSKKAGFKIIEIHGAHGYLIHEFLSPISNNRTDEYGGPFNNRIRLALEITDAIRQEWPQELPLFFRISASEWIDEGWNTDDSIALAKMLKEKNVDLIDCSSGGNINGIKIPVAPMYQTHFAEEIKSAAGIMTGAVGLINTSEEAEKIIREGKADLVFMARQLLREPYFPMHAAKELKAETEWPPQYERAKG